MTSNKTLNLTGHTAKAVPGLSEAPDGLWMLATVQVPDTVGDVIFVDGVDTSVYHAPPTKSIKILAGHIHLLPDGSPAVIGRIEEFKVIPVTVATGLTKALACRITWATSDGGLTPLAKTYKGLYDSGYLDSFSVGISFQYSDTKDNAHGGVDVLKCVLYEVSSVAVPANADATRVKAVKKALDVRDQKDVKPNKTKSEDPSKDEPKDGEDEKHQDEVDFIKLLQPVIDLCTQISDGMKGISESHVKTNERLDLIESAIVVLTGPQKAEENKSVSTKKDLADVLGQLTKKFGK